MYAKSKVRVEFTPRQPEEVDAVATSLPQLRTRPGWFDDLVAPQPVPSCGLRSFPPGQEDAWAALLSTEDFGGVGSPPAGPDAGWRARSYASGGHLRDVWRPTGGNGAHVPTPGREQGSPGSRVGCGSSAAPGTRAGAAGLSGRARVHLRVGPLWRSRRTCGWASSLITNNGKVTW